MEGHVVIASVSVVFHCLLLAASGTSGLGFGKFNMKKKVFATAKGWVAIAS